MYKLINLSIICVIGSILFSSCGSDISITKRRYNKGYFVVHTKAKETVSVPLKKEKAVAASPVRNADQDTVTVFDLDVLSVKDHQQIDPEPTRHGQILGPLTKTEGINKSKIKHRFSVMGKPVINAAEHDHLSLFWIVILILLILWAAGALSGGWGLGGLIHLLLIVALILLILWLLRIL